jgi:hypothetical protein
MKKLVEGADGTFLWTTMVLQLLNDALADGASLRQLRKLLKSHDIYDIYNHMLEKNSDGENKTEARKLLQIILTAARPLSLDEINIAMAIPCFRKSFEGII